MDGGKALAIDVVDTSILTVTTSVPLGGFAAVRSIYERYFALNDRQVTVIEGGNTTSGVVRGVDSDGALVLDSEGRRLRILTGDVSVEGAYD